MCKHQHAYCHNHDGGLLETFPPLLQEMRRLQCGSLVQQGNIGGESNEAIRVDGGRLAASPEGTRGNLRAFSPPPGGTYLKIG